MHSLLIFKVFHGIVDINILQMSQKFLNSKFNQQLQRLQSNKAKTKAALVSQLEEPMIEEEEAEDVQTTHSNSQPNLSPQTSRLQIKQMSTVTTSSVLTAVVISNIETIMLIHHLKSVNQMVKHILTQVGLYPNNTFEITFALIKTSRVHRGASKIKGAYQGAMFHGVSIIPSIAILANPKILAFRGFPPTFANYICNRLQSKVANQLIPIQVVVLNHVVPYAGTRVPIISKEPTAILITNVSTTTNDISRFYSNFSSTYSDIPYHLKKVYPTSIISGFQLEVTSNLANTTKSQPISTSVAIDGFQPQIQTVIVSMTELHTVPQSLQTLRSYWKIFNDNLQHLSTKRAIQTFQSSNLDQPTP